MATFAKGIIPTVHIVDDDASFRTGIGRLLKAAGYAVRTYSSGTEFMRLQEATGPGCVLLDMFMPDGTGLDVQRTLTTRTHRLPIIFVTGQGTIPDTVCAMQAGAVDFLTKPVEKAALLQAVALALANDQEARSRLETVHDTEARYGTLSPRQRAVFRGVVEGKLNKQIAAELDIAERTIKAHRAEVMRKMRATSVAELVHYSLHLLDKESDQKGKRPRTRRFASS